MNDQPTPHPVPAGRIRPARVLVADDDPAVRSILVINLEDVGYQVIEAADGDEAVHLARRAQPDLILLDVMMPGLDGMDVLSILRDHPNTAHIPVVLVTARTADHDVLEGWKAGAAYYITKPFDIDDVLRFVSLSLGTAATV
jgi:DNA-binding response OmpR family regulator